MNRRKLCPGAAASLLLLFLACEMMGPEPKTAPGVDGKALVRIGIEAEGSLGRTVLPAVELRDVSRWKLEGGKSGENKTQLGDFSESDREAFYFYLEPGTWDFTLTGYKDNAPILRGSLTGQTITLEGPNNLSFTAAPILDSGATGTFKITINLPPVHGITTVKVLRDGTELETPLTPVNDKVIFEDTLAAQNYYFSFLLYKGGDLYGVVSEAVQVRANLRSEGSRDLALTALNRTFTITYHFNGGEGDASPGYYQSTDAARTLPIPAKTGYIFGGWYNNANFTGSAETVIPQGSDGDKNFYAKWDSYSYTVTFDKNAEDAEAYPVTKTVDSPATTIDDLPGTPPTRTYYTFSNWNTERDGSGSPFDKNTPVSGNITVYAQWTLNSNIVILKLDAGNDALTQSDFTLSKSGETGSKTLGIAGSGYTNPRWFVDGELKATETGITINAADYGVGTHTLTLLANKSGVSWSKEITFAVEAGTFRRVIFRSNDGTGTIYAIKTLAAGDTLDDFPADPIWSGYIFDGWYTAASGGSPFTSATTVTGDITVYAKWSAETYMVTFDKNGGDTDASPKTKSVTRPDLHIDALPEEPTWTGWNFAGWNTGSGTPFEQTTVVAGNLTVYAQWTPVKFNITLAPDAGSKAIDETSFTGTSFILSKSGTGSQTITRASGYTNPRWFVDGDLKGTGTSITINAVDYGVGEHTLTLLANKSGVSWSKEITFTVEAGDLRRVIFRSNDGTGAIYAIKTLATGSALNSDFPADPRWTGYTFNGWYTAASGGTAFTDTTTVSADTTVYAQWDPKIYTVIFKLNYEDAGPDITRTVTVPAETIADFPDPPPTRTGGWNFAGWNTADNGSGTDFTAATTVNDNITVYAQWARDKFNITLAPDAGSKAIDETSFTGTSFTLSQNGGTQGLSLASGYTNPRWFVDGDLKGTGTSITINAVDYSVGKHHLALLVTRNGVSWSKEITFTVN
jgi:uncharacterized repeat protein (TIGR02543 family)